MPDFIVLFLHAIVTLARSSRPGGARSIVAESLLLGHQLIILNRPRQRAPMLRPRDRVIAGHYRPEPGPRGLSRLTFLGHGKDSLWSMDFFRCESLILRSHWVMVVMDHFTRRIIGFAVLSGPLDGPAVCRMFGCIVGRFKTPKFLSSDNDPLFESHRWKANLRILGINEIKTVPYVPLSHPFIERLIGTIRREFLDQDPFWSARDLQRKLASSRQYYNHARCHQSLSGRTPDPQAFSRSRPATKLNDYKWKPYCRGLYQLPIAA